MTKRKTVVRLMSMLTAFVLCLVGVPFVPKHFEVFAISCRKDGFDKSKYTLTGNMAQDVATIAKSQKGRTRSDFGYTEAWCDEFCADCIENAGGSSAIVGHGGKVADFENVMRNKGAKPFNSPQVGDLVFFGTSHVEIVTKVQNGVVYCAGGNNGSGEGKCAGERTVNSVDSSLGGTSVHYIRPNYTYTPWIFKIENAPKCSSTYWIGEGSVTSGDDVKWVQYALNEANNAGLTVDGVWGTNSKNATLAFQKKYGLTADGQAGTNTINKLVELLSPSTSLDAPVASLKYATPRTLTFNWNAVNGATSYKITFRKSGDEYAVKEENFKGTSYTVTGLDPNTQYYFRVYAKNSSTTSARSETVGGKTPANVDVGTDFFAYITHAKSGKVIGRDSSNNVVLQTKNTSNTAQLWKFVKQSDGSYVIYNGQNKEFKGVLDSTGSNASGSNVYVYDSFVKTSNAQYWYIFNTGNAYSFYTKCTDCTMDLNNYNETDGTNIGMGTYFGNTAQQYKIEKVSCPHNYGSWSTSKTATCTTDGTQTRKCLICGNTESKTIAKTGHSLGEWTTSKAATCTADGTQVRKCNKCSYSEEKTIAKTGHSLGNWTISKNATCTADGIQVRKCSKCSYSEEKVIAKTGHKYTDNIVAPSCTEKGYTLHTCSSCNDSYKDKETNAKGHTFISKMIGGYMTYVCSDCGYMYIAPFEGEGTAESPFIISNADKLRAVSETVNNTEINSIFGHAYYKQTADIDLENISWTPIGIGHNGEDGKGEYNYQTRVFYGVYDGNQHTIYNLNVDNDWIYSGLFAIVRGTDAKVCNLVVYGNVTGLNLVGGIVGELQYKSAIENCAFIGNITDAKICAGGIAGRAYNAVTIRNCYHNGTVTSTGDAGGITGDVSFNKYSSDDDSTLIENCYHVNGEISGEKSGAISSCCIYGDGKTNSVTIKNCYASSSSNYDGKMPDATYDDTVILPDSFLKKIAEDLGEEYTDNTNPELNNGFPVFPWQLDIMLKGDADNNGIVDVNDAIMLQEWLLGASEELTNWKNVDLCEDGVIDVFDLCLLKKFLWSGDDICLKK